MAKSLESALNSALDDLVKTGGGKGKRGRKGKGKGKGKGKAQKPKAAAAVEGEKPAAKKAPKQKSVAGTAEQLNMSLDDIVKGQKGQKKTGASAGEKKAAKGGGKAIRQKLWGGASRLKKGKGKGKGKGQSRDSWDGKGKGRDSWGGKGKGKKDRKGKGDWYSWDDDWKGKGKGGWGKSGKSWGKRGKDKDWERDDESWGRKRERQAMDDHWEPEYPSRRDGRADSWRREDSVYDREPPRRAAERDWSPPPRPAARDLPPRREMRSPPRPREAGRDIGRYAPPPRRAERGVHPDDLGVARRGMKRSFEEEPADRRPGVGSKKIRVSNIPRDLDERDIREAFENEAGKILSCRMDRGVAWIEFMGPKDARKAVDTFDRGELNGKTISVVFDR